MDSKSSRVVTFLLIAIFISISLNFAILFYQTFTLEPSDNNQIIKRQFNEKDQRSSMLDVQLAESDETVHLAVISDGFRSNQHFVTLLKSILFNQQNRLTEPKDFKLHLHVFTLWSEDPLAKILLSWNLPGVAWDIYNLREHVDEVDWIPNKHHSGVLGLSKLLIPSILAAGERIKTSHVLIVDIDMVFETDVTRAWSLLLQMRRNSTEIVFGMTENQSNYYIKGDNNWTARGRGVNSGVILVLLDRLNSSLWRSRWTSVVASELSERSSVKTADQDVFNAVFASYPEMLYILPCEFNCQMPPYVHNFQFCPKCRQSPEVLHFNYPVKNFAAFNEQNINHFRSSWERCLFYATVDGYQFRSKTFSWLKLNDSGQVTDKTKEPNLTGSISPSCSIFTRNTDFRIHPFFMPYSDSSKSQPITSSESPINPNSANQIALLTHLSFDRIEAFERVAKSWNRSISAALYISESQVINFLRIWEKSAALSQRNNIALHVVYEIPGRPYPVNFLRNVALNNSPESSPYVFIVDVDFIFSPLLYDTIQPHLRLLKISDSGPNLVKQAFVVPAFGIIAAGYENSSIPRNKSELLSDWANGFVEPFLRTTRREGQKNTDYIQWVDSKKVYEVQYQMNYEPYIIACKSHLVAFDERFSGYGWNRSMWLFRLWRQVSLQFMVLPQSFILHVPHEVGIWKSYFTGQNDHAKTCIDSLKQLALDEINSKF